MKMSRFTVTIELITDMLGTVPKDPSIYKTYIESKKPEANNGEDESLTVEKIEEKGWTGFHSDEKGLFIYDYMIRGFLKEAGLNLKGQHEIKSIKSKIDKFLFVHPRRIYLGTDKPNGVIERPLRAMTMQGPRVTLTRSDFIAEGTRLTFTITILDNPEKINRKLVEFLLGYGILQGLGQFRNGSYGRFYVVGIIEDQEPELD